MAKPRVYRSLPVRISTVEVAKLDHVRVYLGGSRSEVVSAMLCWFNFQNPQVQRGILDSVHDDRPVDPDELHELVHFFEEGVDTLTITNEQSALADATNLRTSARTHDRFLNLVHPGSGPHDAKIRASQRRRNAAMMKARGNAANIPDGWDKMLAEVEQDCTLAEGAKETAEALARGVALKELLARWRVADDDATRGKIEEEMWDVASVDTTVMVVTPAQVARAGRAKAKKQSKSTAQPSMRTDEELSAKPSSRRASSKQRRGGVSKGRDLA